MAKEKTSGIYFKVSEEDRKLIEQRMELAGIRNMSGYIRKMCIDGYFIILQIPELTECAKLLRYISNNVNQIARCPNPDLSTTALEFWGLPMTFADQTPTNPRKTLQASLTDYRKQCQRTNRCRQNRLSSAPLFPPRSA